MSSLMTTIFGPKCSRCQTRRTRNRYRGEIVCTPCQMELEAAAEPRMTCPKCGATMTKQIQQSVVYDKCPDCGGVWLDKQELESLAAMAAASGQVSGQAAGMILGMTTSPHRQP